MVFLLPLLLVATLPLQRPTDIVKWSAQPPAKAVAAGGTATIALTAQIEAGWKLYALSQPKGGPVPLAINVANGAPYEIDRRQLAAPKAKTQQDDQFNLRTQYHETEARFVVPVMVPKTAAPGAHQVPLEVTFQACGANICLRPYTQKLDVPVTVGR